MKYKVFIDGKEGTTGLRIYERFQNRDDIEVITLSEEDRKDPKCRAMAINSSDITFLCLPDNIAIESVSLLKNSHTKIIDASTAHRTLDNWAYGFPELDEKFLDKIKNSRFCAVPGCHASGFIVAIYPLIAKDIIPKDYPFTINSITGYSGGGKKMISEYEAHESSLLDAPRQYGMGQNHKHLKEMKKITGIDYEPIFNPIVSNFYSGMVVTTPIYLRYLKKKLTIEQLHSFYQDYYKNQPFVHVMPYNPKGNETGYLSALQMSGYDDMYIYVCGNDDRASICAVYDNLGKGASGAAIECMNIMLGIEKTKGLNLKGE